MLMTTIPLSNALLHMPTNFLESAGAMTIAPTPPGNQSFDNTDLTLHIRFAFDAKYFNRYRFRLGVLARPGFHLGEERIGEGFHDERNRFFHRWRAIPPDS